MKKTPQGKSAGFTLIELLVVVLIIGILASIAIPQYFKVVERARVAEAHTFISQLKQSQERYLARNGQYLTVTGDIATKLDIEFPKEGGAGFFGMKFYSAALGAGSGSCDLKYSIELTRVPANAGVAPRYGASGYKVLFDRCESKISYPGCSNCTDFE
ncbi:MAG: prepilin-type N-terminal cleavage/methylation domain-containing protein [Elusimicrobiota bacterium]